MDKQEQKKILIDIMKSDEELSLYDDIKVNRIELVCKDCSDSLEDCTCIEDTIDMKQETLEEAAERLFKIYSNNTSLAEGHYEYMMDKEDFKEASLELSKWQQERMYSEEDLRNAYRWGTTVNQGTKEHFNEWFEQFKKK